MNSNGMYNVLNVFKKLQPVEQPTAKEVAKEIYESVEAKGSILEGVGRVEKKLAEQFASFKEGEKVSTKGGMIHKGTYGSEYTDDDGSTGDTGPKKRGRPAKGTKKVVKKNPPGQRGRPKAEKPMDTKAAPKGDLFGRTTGSVPKGKKGTVVKGKGHDDTSRNPSADAAFAKDDKKVKEAAKNPYAVGMAQAMKSTGDTPPLKKSTISKAHDIAKKVKTNESRLTEGVNFAEMMRETEMTVGEMLETIQNDIKVFKETGMCSDTLEAFLKIHNHGKKQLQDATLPRGPSFAPQHAEIPPVQKPGILDRAKGMVKTGLEKLGHGDDEAMKADLRNKMGIGEELDELARLAGIAEANDGNLANNAKPYDKVTRGDVIAGRLGKDEQGGKKEVDEADVDEGNEFSGELAKAKATGKKEFKVDGKTYPVKEDANLEECMSPMGSMAQDMEQQQGKISVNTNMSSDGNKSVSINADGDAAEQLMQMLKMAGLGGGESHAKLAIAIPADSGDAEVSEAEDQYANTPEEEYAGVDAIVNQGDDMNRQKKQFADKPRQGDNPMATMEEVDPIGSLGRDLMKEYQALKLAK